MAQLFGDPFNLQGSSGSSLQGGYGGLQNTGNPQQAYAPVPSTRPVPAPVATRPATARKTTPVRRVSAAPTLDPSGLVGSLYSPYIGARPSPVNPGVAEFYRKDTNQALDQQGLFDYANSLGLGQVSSFDHLKANAPIQAAGYVTDGSPQVDLTQIDPNQSLAESAAQAGLSVDDYLKLVSSQYGLSPEEKAAINQKLGIPDLENQVFAPAPQTEQLYSDAYNAAGLGNLKAKIDAKLKEIDDTNTKYTDAASRINENPWLSEASLTGRLRILDEKRQAEIANLNNEAQQFQDLYNNGVNEVHNLVSMQSQDFSNNQQLNQQKLAYLLQKAEQQTAEAQAKKSAGVYQYLPAYLKAKAKATKPDTIGSAETGFFRWNPDTGTFEQVIAPKSPQDSYSLGFDPVSGQPYVLNKNTGNLNGGSAGGLGSGPGTNGGGSFSGSVVIPQNIGSQKNQFAWQNNNPGNLKYVGQAGAKQGAGGFAKFDTPEAGFQAYLQQVQLDASRGLTLAQFITKYAPPRENNTAQYIQQAVAALGVSANTPLSQIDIGKLATFQVNKESGTKINGNFGSGGVGQLGGGTVDNLVQQVINNPQLLNQLPDVQQKAVIARMGQLNIPVPTPPKQATDTQNQASAYATRVKQSGSVLDQLANDIANYNIVGFEAQKKLPNNVKSEQIQIYEQAARNLINAILRRESGAAISQSEFDNAYQQYLPYPGDSAAVLAQKKANRDAVLNGLIQSAGSAYSQGSTGNNSNDPLGLGI